MTALINGIRNSEKLSDNTKGQYVERLTTLSKAMGKPVEWFVTHPKEVAEFVQAKYACPLTQRSFVVAIKALFHHNPDLKLTHSKYFNAYGLYQNAMSQEVHERYMNAEPSTKERQNWVTWPEVLAKERELAATEYGSTNHLLLAMYCLIEPLRQDYGAVRILVDKRPAPYSKSNYLIISPDASTGTLILNEYKTAKSYGAFERALPPNLMKIIRQSLLKQPRAYLFVDESGDAYASKNSYAKFSNRVLRKLFGKSFTVSMMRHSHISNIDFNASTPGQLMQTSKNMTHSLAMQQMYRRKVEPAPAVTVIKSTTAPHLTHTHTQTQTQTQSPTATTGVVQSQDGARYLSLTV